MHKANKSKNVGGEWQRDMEGQRLRDVAPEHARVGEQVDLSLGVVGTCATEMNRKDETEIYQVAGNSVDREGESPGCSRSRSRVGKGG